MKRFYFKKWGLPPWHENLSFNYVFIDLSYCLPGCYVFYSPIRLCVEYALLPEPIVLFTYRFSRFLDPPFTYRFDRLIITLKPYRNSRLLDP